MLTYRYRVGQPGHVRMTDAFDHLFGTVLSDARRSADEMLNGAVFPPLNVWEDERAVFIEAELPGFAHEHVDVSVLGDELTLSGSREPAAVEDGTFLRRERRMGQFNRTITLPCEIDAEKVEASLTDGVLLVTLPKIAAAQPRKIAVNAG